MFIKNFADDGIRTEPQPLPKNVFLAFQYEAEKMETGGVSYAVYLYYISNMGLAVFFFSVFFYTISQTFNSLSSIWLSKWSDATAAANLSHQIVSVFKCVYIATPPHPPRRNSFTFFLFKHSKTFLQKHKCDKLFIIHCIGVTSYS